MAATPKNPTAFNDYEGFIEKFKPKKTTDDCYTPPRVYDAIRDWACVEYDIDPARIVRPFYPGGDYERFDYPADCVVLDNPPFSCLAAIRRFYQMLGIDYFLFAPALTMLCSRVEDCCICADANIEYENGAVVRTGFVTNLDTYVLRTAPGLYKAIEEVKREIRSEQKKQLPRYEYPEAVITPALCNRYTKYGIDFRVKRDEAVRISSLDEQRTHKKGIFGGGLLLSKEKAAERTAAEHAAVERAAAERAAAHTWHLSERELELQATLG